MRPWRSRQSVRIPYTLNISERTRGIEQKCVPPTPCSPAPRGQQRPLCQTQRPIQPQLPTRHRLQTCTLGCLREPLDLDVDGATSRRPHGCRHPIPFPGRLDRNNSVENKVGAYNIIYHRVQRPHHGQMARRGRTVNGGVQRLNHRQRLSSSDRFDRSVRMLIPGPVTRMALTSPMHSR